MEQMLFSVITFYLLVKIGLAQSRRCVFVYLDHCQRGEKISCYLGKSTAERINAFG